jgi:hypothetical protein
MSSDWINTYDAVFFVTIGTLLFGCFGVLIKYCLKSRCDNVSLCFGFVTVHRDVKTEEEIEIRRMELGIKDDEEEEKKE